MDNIMIILYKDMYLEFFPFVQFACKYFCEHVTRTVKLVSKGCLYIN